MGPNELAPDVTGWDVLVIGTVCVLAPVGVVFTILALIGGLNDQERVGR